MTGMAIDFTLSAELEDIRIRVRTFVDHVVKPGEAQISASQMDDADRMDRKDPRGRGGGIRNPKLEIRNPKRIQNPRLETRNRNIP
jgi:hypothetical protein